MKATFNFRLEEFPTVCNSIRDSFERDMPEFTAYSVKYNKSYLDALDLKIAKMDNIVNNKIKIGELKQMTTDLYEKTESLRPELAKIEGYVINVEGLTVPAKNFRFKEARNGIGSKDMESVLLEIKTIKKLLKDNMTVLTAEGYTKKMDDDFGALIADIDTKNKTRNLKVDEKEAVVQDNMVFFNGLYKDIKKIADIGKRIYRYINKEKTGDYTIRTILGRISNRTPRGAKKKGNAFVEGVTKDFETEAIVGGVKVWTNDNTKGMVSGVDGRYRLKVVAETCETIFASKDGYVLYEDELDIDAGVTMELDIEIEKKEEIKSE